MKSVKTSIFVLFIILASFAQAQTGENVTYRDSLLSNMTFEQLLDVEVITISRYRENINKSSGLITVISKNEIENIGANNLFELLDRLPSTYAIGSYIFPQNTLSIRGDLPTHLSPHFLILINGRPFRESINAGMNANILNAFPVSAIDRIEFVRGPGSVLYGTNAYSGVINIITRIDDNLKASVEVKTGSFGTYAIEGGISLSHKKFESQLYVKTFQSKGWEFDGYISQRDSLVKTVDYGLSNTSLFYQAKYGDFNFTSSFGKNQQTSLSNSFLLPFTWVTRRWFNNLGYEKVISEKFEIQSNLTHNTCRNEYTSDTSVLFNMNSDDLLLEFTTFYKPTENLKIISGGLSNYTSGFRKDFSQPTSDQTVLPQYHHLAFSFYTQADYLFRDKIKVVLGIQANKAHNYKLDLVPRVGLVIAPVENFGFKFSYGSAFRSPSGSELDLKLKPIVEGDPSLLPEKINTCDAQFFVNIKPFDFSLNYFYSFQSNLISRTTNPSPLYYNKSANIDSLINHGIEAVASANINTNLKITSSFLYQENYNSMKYNISQMPNTHFKIGAYYKLGNTTLGVFNHYVGKANVQAKYELNGQAEAYNYLTAKLSFNLKDVLKCDKTNNATVYIYGVNLLNEKIYYPEISSKELDSVPGRAGIALYFGARFTF